MAKVDKRLDKWLNNTPKDVPRHEVEAMLDRFFPNQWRMSSGSHIVVSDDNLKGLEDYGPKGDFDIPVHGGKRVKGYYLKKLVYTINLYRRNNGR